MRQGPATLTTTVYFKDPLRNGPELVRHRDSCSVNTTALALQASLSPAQGVAPLSSTLNVNASDPSGLPMDYTVDFGDGTPAATGTIAYPYNPITLNHTFADAGLDTVDVSVSDSSSGFSEQQLNASVLNATLPIGLSADPVDGHGPACYDVYSDHKRCLRTTGEL